MAQDLQVTPTEDSAAICTDLCPLLHAIAIVATLYTIVPDTFRCPDSTGTVSLLIIILPLCYRQQVCVQLPVPIPNLSPDVFVGDVYRQANELGRKAQPCQLQLAQLPVHQVEEGVVCCKTIEIAVQTALPQELGQVPMELPAALEMLRCGAFLLPNCVASAGCFALQQNHDFHLLGQQN